MVTDVSKDKTEVGNYFISNYPPFSFWNRESLPSITEAFETPSTSVEPMGLYLHIPFCRKRCKFCYFRVYTDVQAKAIQDYVDTLAHEVAMIAEKPAVQGREFRFVYFGGGTPSFLSERQLLGLVDKLRTSIRWDNADEVTFECEPGTLSQPKLEAIKEIGVTRLSLGVENFDDAVLEENGRAHKSKEIFRAWDWIQETGFKQINIDLIAGMIGETTENWEACIKRTIDLSPDSVTIYQLELPYNTRYSKSLTVLGQEIDVAPWSLKRQWLNYAYDELLANGYEISSAYTLRKKSTNQVKFLYRDNLWHGSDLLCAGVASFGHLSGVHYQNIDGLEEYQAAVAENRLPLNRALVVSPEESLIRQMILQMKLGRLDAGYFRSKFGREIFTDFRQPFEDLVSRELARIDGDKFTLTREGFLRVDSLLPAFFKPEHQGNRYT
ncbi:coproporphyrinogen III oxidase family protein [bacterium]|nr:coproporphyrinogen III oxidase family protein [bacterium]